MSLKRNYVIGDLIGSGSMATIHRGVQKSLDRVVAIKKILPHLAESPEFVMRFEREAKASANLKHVNIMDIIDFGVDEREGYYIVMEMVDGPSLARLLRHKEPMPLDVAVAITAQILAGLEHAHNSGVVHRDIKPSNVLLTSGGVAKISDFGIALAGKLPSLTQTGQRIGTPAYMSPEQAEGKRLDHRSDLFSVGIILYEMLAQKAPFVGDDVGVRRAIVEQQPVPLLTAEPSVPAELAAIVERALEKDVSQRFFDAAEFAYTLESFALTAGLRIGPRACQPWVKRYLESGDAKQPAPPSSPSQIRREHPSSVAKVKPTVGILPLQGCFGCQVNILDLHQRLGDLLKLVDIKFSYLADIKDVPELDIGLVEGAVANEENEARLKAFRLKCKRLVTLGTCATYGGIPGLRNLHSARVVMGRSYGGPGTPPDPTRVPPLLPQVKAVSQVVDVDAAMPGCPSPPHLVLAQLTSLVDGTSLGIPTHNLCFECKREHKSMLIPQRAFVANDVQSPMELERIDPELCFLEQGVPCLGIATRQGCGARCTGDNAPCQGCMGPPPNVKETGAKWIDALGSLLPGGALRFRHDVVGAGYRYTLPTSLLPTRKDPA
jgi:serine/threonine protein kinase